MDLERLGKSERRVTVRVGGQKVEVMLRVLGDRTAALEHGVAAMQATLARLGAPRRAREQARAIAALPRDEVIEALLAWEGPRLAEAVSEQMRRGARTGVAPRRDPRETETAFAARAATHRAAEQRALRGADRSAARELAARLAASRSELDALPAAVRAERALGAWREAQGLRAFERAVEDFTLFEAVRKPVGGGRHFKSAAGVRELHPAVRARLLKMYRVLDSGGDGLPFG